MEVILLERIEKLGQMGDVVRVRPGYARNYLLPTKKAIRATKDNMTYFEQQRAQLEARNLKLREEAQSIAKRMEGTGIVLIRAAGEGGQLYGSVSVRDIAEALDEAGFTIARSQVMIDRPMKSLGLFQVRVALHAEVSILIDVNIARSRDEAAMQQKVGGMVTAEMAEAAQEEAEAEAEAETEAGTAEAETAAESEAEQTTEPT